MDEAQKTPPAEKLGEVPVASSEKEVVAIEATAEMLSIIESFSRGLPQRVLEIQTAAHRSDWVALQQLAHRLISADLFGFKQVGDLAREIARFACNCDQEKCSQLVRQLAHEVDVNHGGAGKVS